MIDIINEGTLLTQQEEAAIRIACEAALAHEGRQGDAVVLLTGEEEIQCMNREYRGKDSVTDVLSFPAQEGEELLAPPGFLGDIMICYARASQQAETFGHSRIRELAFLAVHGMLHLMGYDHMQPEEEAVMRKRQTEIMQKVGISA